MKVLKTIVATAVIVFALTTVAMAGVQQFTKQSGRSTGSQAQAARPAYAVTLTAAQLAQLMNGGKAATAGGAQHARHAQHHARAAAHHASSHRAGAASHDSARGSRVTHHYEPMHHHEATHHSSSSDPATGGHHAEASHHSGDHGDGGGSCGD
jgi:hypothetical protein